MAAASLWLSPCHRAAGELAECLARLRRQLSHAACIQHLHVQNRSARGQSAGVSSAQREWACVPGCSPLQCHQAQAGSKQQQTCTNECSLSTRVIFQMRVRSAFSDMLRTRIKLCAATAGSALPASSASRSTCTRGLLLPPPPPQVRLQQWRGAGGVVLQTQRGTGLQACEPRLLLKHRFSPLGCCAAGSPHVDTAVLHCIATDTA